mgnify:CR=1 FL=1
MPSNAPLAQRLARQRLTRRDVLWFFSAATLSGCAQSPIGGKSILDGNGLYARTFRAIRRL